jgi:hypothetical protein
MTAQINDSVFHRKRRYSVAGVSGKGLFDPASYGIQAKSFSTACWRGFHVDYEVIDSRLTLTAVSIELPVEHRAAAARGELTFAPGLRPAKDKFGVPRFEGLSLPIPYTGGLLLGDSFIRKLYVHMGFHPAWKYQNVRELIFEQGTLLEDHDRSAKMATLRERLASEPLRPGIDDWQEIQAWVERCFSRDYYR